MGDREYFLERERAERALANSPEPKAAEIHFKLAERYAKLAREAEERERDDGAQSQA